MTLISLNFEWKIEALNDNAVYKNASFSFCFYAMDMEVPAKDARGLYWLKWVAVCTVDQYLRFLSQLKMEIL